MIKPERDALRAELRAIGSERLVRTLVRGVLDFNDLRDHADPFVLISAWQPIVEIQTEILRRIPD